MVPCLSFPSGRYVSETAEKLHLPPVAALQDYHLAAVASFLSVQGFLLGKNLGVDLYQ